MDADKANRLLRELADKQEIHEVLMRYCRGIDRCDAELLRSVYHPDASDNHGLFVGKAVDFIRWALEGLKRDLSTKHYVTNELVELRGDVAHVESYLLAIHHRTAREGGLVDLVMAGRYVDRFERRNGEWKIADRKVILDWARIDPVGKSFSVEKFLNGRRSREDEVYRRPWGDAD
ncbi:MAG TPA: nuclear transport factor 2 family protein [Candidatus Binataceae bacterium]|nr:nuclear transport factor 2 family protein [Candidatus Binataceae bacterium]